MDYKVTEKITEKLKDLTFKDIAKIVLASVMLGCILDKLSDLLGWVFIVFTLIATLWEYIAPYLKSLLGWMWEKV